MLSRWWSFAVWALVAGSALFWGFRLFVKAPQAPLQTTLADLGTGARGDLTRVFGPDPVAVVEAAAPEPVADARFQLIGVVSPRGAGDSSQGLALIAVDGKPAKAYRVGSVVDGQTVLQSVRARGAALGPRGGSAQVALEIAPPVAAATGSFAEHLAAQRANPRCRRTNRRPARRCPRPYRCCRLNADRSQQTRRRQAGGSSVQRGAQRRRFGQRQAYQAVGQ
jgi:general secretion pathway protein C